MSVRLQNCRLGAKLSESFLGIRREQRSSLPAGVISDALISITKELGMKVSQPKCFRRHVP